MSRVEYAPPLTDDEMDTLRGNVLAYKALYGDPVDWNLCAIPPSIPRRGARRPKSTLALTRTPSAKPRPAPATARRREALEFYSRKYATKGEFNNQAFAGLTAFLKKHPLETSNTPLSALQVSPEQDSGSTTWTARMCHSQFGAPNQHCAAPCLAVCKQKRETNVRTRFSATAALPALCMDSVDPD